MCITGIVIIIIIIIIIIIRSPLRVKDTVSVCGNGCQWFGIGRRKLGRTFG